MIECAMEKGRAGRKLQEVLKNRFVFGLLGVCLLGLAATSCISTANQTTSDFPPPPLPSSTAIVTATPTPYLFNTPSPIETIQPKTTPIGAEDTKSSITDRENVTKYPMISELYTELLSLSERYPGLVEVFSAGKSLEGRDILFVEMGSKNASTLFVEANIHAREVSTSQVSMQFIYEILERIMADPTFLENKHVVVVPVANPDGYNKVVAESRIDWRKNTADPSRGSIICEDGDENWGAVDLNRDYGKTNTDDLPDPCAYNYHPEQPLSQPESQALHTLRSHILSHGGYYITIHSGTLEAEAWAYDTTIAKLFADATGFPMSIHSASEDPDLYQNSTLADIMGTSYDEAAIIHPVLIELPSLENTLFIPPLDGIQNQYKLIKPGLFALLQYLQ